MSRAVTWVVAGVVTVLTLVLLVAGAAPSTLSSDPSSRSAGRAGTLALYRWLGALGFDVSRVSGSFDLGGRDVLVVNDPTTAFTAADTAAVMATLRRGADLVLALSPAAEPAAAQLLSALGVRLAGSRGAGSAAPAEPFDSGDRVAAVPMGAGAGIVPSPRQAPLLRQGAALSAVAEPVGDGRAYVLASPLALSNDGLRREDSATFVLALLERARGGHIAFDEYHHGEATLPADGAAAIFQSPLGLALALAAVALLVHLAIAGRRLGPPLPAHDPAAVPSTAAYVEAMAGLYARSRERGAVAARYGTELRRRLGSGGPAREDAELVERVRIARPELAAAAAHALRTSDALARSTPDTAALLALAREVDDVETQWAGAAGEGPHNGRP